MNAEPEPDVTAVDRDDMESPAVDWARLDAPKVSVIIPHYNDLANLCTCLSLLRTQTMAAESFEIVVADNNSPCGIAAVETACARLARVVPAPIQGAAEARNAAVRAARGDILAFIDSDCRPFPDWLQRGVEALQNADMVGGRVDVVADGGKPNAVEAFELVFAFNLKRYIEKVGFSVTANMFVSRAIFEKVGGFRAGVSEDVDWGQRAVALGYRWRYAPDAAMAHPARRDWADLTRKWRRVIKETYATEREKPLGNLRWILRSWLVLLSPLIHVPTVLRSTKLKGFDLRLKVIVVLFRLRCWRFWKSYVVLFDPA